MLSRKEKSDQYQQLCERTAEILADVDPMRITISNPNPQEEYAAEAAEISRSILRRTMKGEVLEKKFVATVVLDVFQRQFDEDIGLDCAETIAGMVDQSFKDL